MVKLERCSKTVDILRMQGVNPIVDSGYKSDTTITYCHYSNTGCQIFQVRGTKLERCLPKNQHTYPKEII